MHVHNKSSNVGFQFLNKLSWKFHSNSVC